MAVLKYNCQRVRSSNGGGDGRAPRVSPGAVQALPSMWGHTHRVELFHRNPW